MSPDERALRTQLVDAEIRLDAMERYPLLRDLGWQRMQITALKAWIANLKRQIATVRVLAEMSES